MTEPADVNVDDLRRRARRRLVGAIVLALAAAVFVPMLLESEPKPLGEDVSVRIPPVDDGRFVNRLNEKVAQVEPARGDVKTEAAAPKSAPPAAPSGNPASKGATSPTTAAAPAAAAAPSPSSAAPPSSATNTGTDATATLSVQLAAFADDKGANALASKLKNAGYPAYTEPLTTSRGTLWRVRVGPYPTRDAAVASRDKLKSEGYSGIVAPSK